VVNEWIRTSGAFDAVIDFDELVRDPQDPTRLKKEYSDDWLHLNPAGYAAMGKLAAEVYKR
jgi:lysophospholipase L1-like esterase